MINALAACALLAMTWTAPDGPTVKLSSSSSTLTHHDGTATTPPYDTVPQSTLYVGVNSIPDGGCLLVMVTVNGAYLWSEAFYANQAPVISWRPFTYKMDHSVGGVLIRAELWYYEPIVFEGWYYSQNVYTFVASSEFYWKHPLMVLPGSGYFYGP